MTFFYNLNKKLDEIRATPELTHKQLNERDMSRAAKGYEKYGKEGMEALAKAGREGKDLDKVRAKYDKYDDKSVDEGLGDVARKVGGAVKKVAGKAMDALHGSDEDMIRDLQKKAGMPQHGKKGMAQPNPKKVSENTGGKITQPVSQWLQDPRLETQTMSLTAYGINVTDPSKGFDGDDANDPGTPSKYSLISTKATNPMYFKEFLNMVMKKDPAAKVAGIVQAGPELAEEGDAPMSAKQKSFAALAEPKDKITFADKIAGAKKEVDEMLGDVAAEAMKKALGGGRGRDAEMDEGSENNAFTAHKRPRVEKPAVGTITHGRKHDVEEIPGGRRVTRRVDPSGISVGADDEQSQSGEKRGRGRPKGPAKAPERVTGGATKHKGGRKAVEEGDNESDDIKQAMAMLKKAGYKVSKATDGAEQVDEKAVSKKQQKFMGMVHATQKGEKAPSKEVAKVAKTMKKSDAEDFAATKHKGLPEKKKPEGKKKEKTEEAGGSGTPTASSGFGYGKGIYDSLNRDLELMIAESMSRLDESMNISMNMSNDAQGGPGQSLTVTATDEDATTLASLLKSAGLGGGAQGGGCGCGGSPCSCGNNAEVVDENQPDYPTNTETSADPFQYSGGLNKPKETGQTTVPVIASQDERQESYAEAEEDAIKRMMEMAGIAEAKKVDEDDVEEGNKFTGNLAKARAAGKKEADLDGDGDLEKVDESIFAMTRNLWNTYKG